MAFLRQIPVNGSALLREIDDFEQFLATKPRGERKQFLPFFARHPQLCAYLGFFNSAVRSATHIATEFSLWGDFTCDLVAGSIRDKAFVCVEFEDAKQNSLFSPQAGRRNSHWGTRVEHGMSQVIDWLFRINGESGSDQLQRDFGARHLRLMGLVIVGRSDDLSEYDRVRLEWRSQNTIVGGANIWILTYDDLLEWLKGRVEMIRRSDEISD
ncbi:MAG: DUF4263 domain-containing protein [Deltaproteobacteria bacterium]|nr:DUF4263 domain-containing protein [Deltaproteobacteria bacterium]